jgi:hypothetical protein
MRRLIFDKFLTGHTVDKVLLAAAWKENDIPALENTIDLLKSRGFDVIVLGPLVEYKQPLPRILADEIRYRRPKLAETLRDPKIPILDKRLAELVKQKGASYISLYSAVCPNGSCETFAKDNVPFQFDAGHLTEDGSIKLGRQLVRTRRLF